MNLEGKHIVVTGAGSGIGRSLVTMLAAYPVVIVAADVAPKSLISLAAEFEQIETSATLFTFVCDLSSDAGNEKLFDYASTQMSYIDLFFANAGAAHYGLSEEVSWAGLEHLFALNTLFPIDAANRLKRLNPERPYRVVMTASSMALVALPGYALYSASKGALHRFAEAYRFELGLEDRNPCTLTLIYPIATRSHFFECTKAPLPWPNQSPERVAQAIIRGVEKDKREIHPSRLLRLFIALEPLLPGLRRLIQWREGRRLKRWLKDKR